MSKCSLTGAIFLSAILLASVSGCVLDPGRQKDDNQNVGVEGSQTSDNVSSAPTPKIDSSADAPTNPVIVPESILAQLPTGIANQIKKDGFESLPADTQAKILQVMKSSAQSPANGSNSTANLPPTGENNRNLIPLNDLGKGTYKGYQGGLYDNGSNAPSREYLQIGLNSAAQISPLNSNGVPDASGKIVLLTVGFSNTTMESQEFIKVANADPQKNPKVFVVDGAVGGRDAIELSNPGMTRYWDELQAKLDKANVTSAQVQAIWLKEVVAGDTLPFPQDAERFRDTLIAIVKTLKTKFPNLHLIYVSSRTYGGYALRNGSQEPWAYEGAFAYKWMIENWEKGPTPGDPWVAWGPYLWANGSTPRSDGLTWNLSDFRTDDQMHPSPSGMQKVAQMLSNFFKTDPTAKSWYLR